MPGVRFTAALANGYTPSFAGCLKPPRRVLASGLKEFLA
jgi:hypothetical protein